jgi:hypothetical protein
MPKTLLDSADTRLPVRILQRLPAAQATAEERAAVIHARLAPKFDGLNARIRALQREPIPKKAKLVKLRRLVDDIAKVAADQAACRKGCTHCCHIPVAMVQSEADLIGKEIGRPARRLKKSTSPESRGFGYHMPCPFLKDNACSIYEHRPFSCRVQLNLDVDALLCELQPDMTVPVPYLDMTTMQSVYMALTAGDNLGDLRDFFPVQPEAS